MPTHADRVFMDDAFVARQSAQRVLEDLIEAQTECEQRLAAGNRVDLMRMVTGKSAIDSAIERTRALIERIDRALEHSPERVAISTV